MITLHHGSNVPIENIDLSLSKKGKDFGKGFYLNESYQQALSMAERTARMLECGTPTVSTFNFDIDAAITDGLQIKIFDDYCEEWAEFVVMNRKNVSDLPAHDYDIVIGPIADDTVGVQIRRYVMGYMAADLLVDELKYKGNHAVQYFFGTEKSIKHLKRC